MNELTTTISKPDSIPATKQDVKQLIKQTDKVIAERLAKTEPRKKKIIIHRARRKPKYEDLTARQEQILLYIQSYIQENGFSPSVREIGDHVHLTSPSAVQHQLDQLQNKGYIRRTKGRHRMIEVVENDNLNVKLDQTVIRRLRAYCERNQLTEDTLVEQILKTSLPKEKETKREQYG